MNKKKVILIIIGFILVTVIVILVIFSRTADNNSIPSHDDTKQEDLVKREEINMDDPVNVDIHDGKKYNNSTELKENHYVKNGEGFNKAIVISDIEVYADSETNTSYFKAKITNNSDKNYDSLSLFLNFYREKNTDYIFFSSPYTVKNFKKGSTKNIKLEILHEDFSNAYDVEILY